MIHVFVINSIATKPDFGTKLREYLKTREDIKYFVFSTSYAGMEQEIVERMIRFFDSETIRFYCCGGSGTMRNMIQGSGDRKDVEFAFFPQGKTNDFLKIFGDKQSDFENIDNLIAGRVTNLDLIKTNYGYALNSISFGIDTTLTETLDRTREYYIFGKSVPSLLSYLRALTGAKPRRMNCTINGKAMSENITEFIIGNGIVLGGAMHFSDDVNVKDGELNYLMAINQSGLSILKTIRYMIKNDLAEVRKRTKYGKCSTFLLSSDDGRDISLNLDGEIVRGGPEWKIEVYEKGLKFVIPKGMQY